MADRKVRSLTEGALVRKTFIVLLEALTICSALGGPARDETMRLYQQHNEHREDSKPFMDYPLHHTRETGDYYYTEKVFQGRALELSVMHKVPQDFGQTSRNLTRRKRAVPAHYTKLWGEKIPYVLHTTFRSLSRQKKDTLKRAMHFISDHLCVRFEDETRRYRQGSTTWLPQAKYPDGNFILIKHSGTVCRANIDLEHRTGHHTVEPCDDFKVNVHEMLHMLRGNHMHQGSQRDRYITINRDDIDPVLRTTYARMDGIFQENFDPFSPLMYGPMTWSVNHLETWTAIRDDIAESDSSISKAPVEFEELNNMYKCGERFCPWRDCGPGYLARVKGRCTCVCPREYDPLTNCTFHIEGPTQNLTWPNAPFSLFAPGLVTNKCPQGFDAQRTVKFKTYWGGQDWQMMRTPEHYEMPWPWAYMPVCTRSSVSRRDWKTWPEGGDFCIIKPKRYSCKADFSEYSVWIRGQARAVYSGDVGDFRFSSADMTLKMCCRSGVTWGWPLELPNGEPFRLISGGSCPKVEGMREYQTILLLSSRMRPRKWGYGARPWVNIFKDQLQIRTCYYMPPVYGCNMEISLDDVESSITLTTPGYHTVREPNRRCFYNFLVPDGARVKVTFNNVDLQEEDKMYVRRFHKWQQPYPLDRNLYPHEMVSEKSYLALEWWSSFVTYQVTNKGVNFTATVLLAEDSCYNVTTRGADYAGDHTYSETFEECLPWADMTDCTDFPHDTADTFWLLSAGNKCRNPAGRLSQPWCYTYKNGTSCHKRYCDVCNQMVPTDVIKNCSALVAEKPNFCNSSISRFGCFKTCNMSRPVYTPGTCGPPPVPADGQLVEGSENSTYRQGEHVFVRCSNPRDPVISGMKCTADGWTVLTHACSASYSEPCPEGWMHHGARCFRYFTTWKTRREAEVSCRSQTGNGTLFQVRDVADQVMLRRFRHRQGERSIFAHGMWISGELGASDSRWYYSGTWEEMKYFNWTLGAVTANTHQNCIKMTAEYSWGQDAGAWKTLPCDDTVGVAPYVCQTDLLDAELSDRSDLCQSTLARTPYLCNSTGTRYVAHLYCGRSCDSDNGTVFCDEPESDNSNQTSTSPSLGSGEVMTFSCPQGQHLINGSVAQACGLNGTLLGESPSCSDAPPSKLTVKVDSLRKRADTIRAYGVYLLDNDAYRVPIRGNITAWFYFCSGNGYLNVAVFNKTGINRYNHIGTNTFVCEAGYRREYVVPSANQIAADAGDVIAVMSAQHHTLSANQCDGADNEIMVSPFAWALNVTVLQRITVFPNSSCLVPSLGYTIEP